jgi:hypothetical protein
MKEDLEVLRIALRIVFLLSIRSHTGQGCKTNTDVISSKHFYFINSMDVFRNECKNYGFTDENNPPTK